MINVTSRTVTSTEVDGIGVVLSGSPVDFLDSHEKRVGDKIVLAYCVNDFDPENPLESMDGEGRIYTAHRHSTTLQSYFEAVGLDQYGERDYEAILQHPETYKGFWVKRAAKDEEFHGWCAEHAEPRDPSSEELTEYYTRLAGEFWDNTGGCNAINAEIADFKFAIEVEDQVYKHLVAEGEIGDKDAVMLDVYEHSAVSYSVSGEGMQCMFDTARGGAVWVPDECAREEIERRSKVYRHGVIQAVKLKTVDAWTFKLDTEEMASQTFPSWGECFEAAAKMVEGLGEGDESLGRQRAARELAKSACELYTDYCNGAVYGIVVEVHQVDPAEEDEAVLVSSDDTYGLYGFQNAESELLTEFESRVKELSAEHQSQTHH